ncbi:MAG: symbB, partial [Burkholderiales bacterium]|nr:symbB [Burkholderiales bacterium]
IEAIFQRHRETYLSNWNSDPTLSNSLEKAAALGIKIVRLPITWVIQYDKSYIIQKSDGSEQIIPATTGKVQLIPDPFYPSKRWASIPINQLEAILKTANSKGTKIILDIHTFPGGASDGTYNGVWPNAPKFWSVEPNIYKKNFQTIFDKATAKEELNKSNNDTTKDLSKIKICSAFDETGKKAGVTSWGASPVDVLSTLAYAVKKFENTPELTNNNIKLYMNIIETMYDEKTINPFQNIGTWWKSITSQNERSKWAVLDIHHYIAWGKDCNDVFTAKQLDLTSDGQIKWKGPGYTNPVYKTDSLGDLPLYLTRIKKNDGSLSYSINEAGFTQIKACSNWFLNIRNELGLSREDKLAASEFSAGTNADTFNSGASGVGTIVPTNFAKYRNEFLQEQVMNANKEGITAIFWTWAIPYNSNFQNEWSFSNICSGANKALLPGICK